MEAFDVVIVGAGPAGLKCAETLGNSEYKVLVLEKNAEIGPKVCAGGLTRKSFEYLKVPKSLIESHSNTAYLHINNSVCKIKAPDYHIYTINRKTLGHWQLKKLKKYNNIEIRTKAKVSKIQKNHVVVDNQKIFYKFLVGADGSASLVRRYLGLPSKNIALAFQYIIPKGKYRNFEIFLNSKLFSTWYSWIFPHKNYVSVGCVCNPGAISPAQLKNNFAKWLKLNQIDVTKARFEAFIINYDYRGHQFKNIFLVGDTGGFASGLTGEGIYQAVVSGEGIGRIILNKKSDNINLLLKTKKKHNQLVNFLLKCGRFRTVIFHILVLFSKVPLFKKKLINFFV